MARWATGLANGMTGLEGLLSPTARIWHSTDGEWLSRDLAQRRMVEKQVADAGTSAEFRELRFHAIASGGVIQAVIGSADDIVHIVQMLTIEGGQIVALEEYVAAQSSGA